MKIALNIEGMSCGHCTSHVQKELDSLEGVSNVIVDLETKTAVFESGNEISKEKFVEIIDEAGYELTGYSVTE